MGSKKISARIKGIEDTKNNPVALCEIASNVLKSLPEINLPEKASPDRVGNRLFHKFVSPTILNYLEQFKTQLNPGYTKYNNIQTSITNLKQDFHKIFPADHFPFCKRNRQSD